MGIEQRGSSIYESHHTNTHVCRCFCVVHRAGDHPDIIRKKVSQLMLGSKSAGYSTVTIPKRARLALRK